MKKKALICMATLALMTAGCGQAPAEPEKTAQAAGKVVEVAVASKPENPVPLRSTGIVEAKRDVILSFGTSGKISQIYVKKGTQVKEGSLLASLDTGYYQKAVEAASSQVKQAAEKKAKTLAGASAEEIAETKLRVEGARIRLDKATADLVQGETLFAGGAISKSELDNLRLEKTKAELEAKDAQIALDRLMKGAEADEIASDNASVQLAASQMEQAKKTLQDTRLVAPFSGTVVEINQEAGELSNPGQDVIHLVDMSEMTVSLDVTNETIEQYKMGARVAVISPNGVSANGTITFISPVIDQKTGKYRVEVTFPNQDQSWRGGMIATVEIPRSIKGVVVPLESVGFSQAERYVMVAENGAAKRRIVEVGQVIDDQIEVLSGLKEKDQVIVSGITFLVEGEKIVAKGAK